MTLPTVAIVGRPNVGKSTILTVLLENVSRLLKIFLVTRDRIYATGEWLNKNSRLLIPEGLNFRMSPS